jgi:hypothetical protein
LKRPQDWFSFEYSIACRDKERCQFAVAVAESELKEMTPGWTKKYNKPMKLNADEKVMWSFTRDSTSELRNRFIKGKGYLYWD